ncbi:MAG: CAP domain-containing protein, partial [Oscillospiraceae bacterium]|nr:CAP domain-containing protein [Oscillospiraceae bacterium]
LIANHCTLNKPQAGEFPTSDYLSDVPNGYRGADGNTYTFDMEASRSFTMKPTALHYLNDKLEMFYAMDTSTKPTTNMELLPNVARSSYNINNADNGTVLLERTDGSMWMVQLWSRVTAADKVAKLGGWENSNVFQITQPTTKVSGRCDYVDLVGGEGSTVVNRGPVDAPDTKPAAYVNDSHYVNLSPYQAEKKYLNGEKFVLMVCTSTCGWCKRLKSGLPATLSAADYSIYGVTDDGGDVSFYWDFVRGDSLGTPFVVIVNGKNDVEVVSAIHSQSEMTAVLQKAKSKGIPSAVGTGQTTPTTPTVEAKLPSDKLSVTAFEWEVLKLTNQERYKAGLELLSMPAALQTACDIREKELATLYEHTRPNGQPQWTAIPEGFPYKSAENIAEGQLEPQQVMRDWMNSTMGHKENILRERMCYFGAGVNTSTPYHWVQLFTTGEITSVTSSSGSLTFPSEEAMQGEYLICTGKNGVESYLPIDVSVMTKSGSSYT